MKFYVAVTRPDWFEYLEQRQPEEVNFWRPGSRGFTAIEPGTPFLFKLPRPRRAIVGGGIFVRHFFLPVSLAWDAFGENNGSPDYHTLRTIIRKRAYEVYRHRPKNRLVEPDPIVGCIIISKPYFFPEQDWIPEPSGWSYNNVQGKTYDTRNAIDKLLWEQVEDRLIRYNITHPSPASASLDQEAVRYGRQYLVRPRIGQGEFHVLVADAYGRRCAITGEHTLPVLQASHIKPYSKSGPNEVRNGIFLRADVHILFDRGFLTVTKDLRIRISESLERDVAISYRNLQNSRLNVLPARTEEWPAHEFIDWHHRNVFIR